MAFKFRLSPEQAQAYIDDSLHESRVEDEELAGEHLRLTRPARCQHGDDESRDDHDPRRDEQRGGQAVDEGLPGRR